MLVIAVIFAPVIYTDMTQQSKEDWRGTATTLSGLTSDGDTVVIVPAYIQPTLDYYYRDNVREIGISSLRDMPEDPDWFVVTNDLSAVDQSGRAERLAG